MIFCWSLTKSVKLNEPEKYEIITNLELLVRITSNKPRRKILVYRIKIKERFLQIDLLDRILLVKSWYVKSKLSLTKG